MNIATGFAGEIEKQLEEEKKMEMNEDAAFAILEARTVAERDQEVRVCEERSDELR